MNTGADCGDVPTRAESPPTAAQNAELGQETELRLLPAAIGAGGDHEVPSYVSALPTWSTAAQKVALGQETDSTLFTSIDTAADHEVPLKVRAPLVLSTAVQKVALAHDTVLRPCPASIAAGAVHEVPL